MRRVAVFAGVVVVGLVLAGCREDAAPPAESPGHGAGTTVATITRSPCEDTIMRPVATFASCIGGYAVDGAFHGTSWAPVRPELIGRDVLARGTVDGCDVEMRPVTGIDRSVMVAWTRTGCPAGDGVWRQAHPPGRHDPGTDERVSCLTGYPVRTDEACRDPRSPRSYLTGEWDLVTINHRGVRGRPVRVPASLGAGARFGPGDAVVFDDGINRRSGRMSFNPRGFTLGPTYSTKIGYSGDDPAVRTTIDAIDAIVRTLDDRDAPGRVRTKPGGDRLFVYAGPYILTFRSAELPPD